MTSRIVVFVSLLALPTLFAGCGGDGPVGYCITEYGDSLGVEPYSGMGCLESVQDPCEEAGGTWTEFGTEFTASGTAGGAPSYCSAEFLTTPCPGDVVWVEDEASCEVASEPS